MIVFKTSVTRLSDFIDGHYFWTKGIISPLAKRYSSNCSPVKLEVKSSSFTVKPTFLNLSK